ncbi:MAG: hypothetical protein IJ083_16905 [Clostridia bacterium]|nr:hypothetical protein [Clostridia bacterium]
MAVLNGEKPDRVPVCFWHHFGELAPEETVKEHVRFFRETGEDILKMMCDEFFVYPLGGASTSDDYRALRPQGYNSYYVRGQAERASQINEALSGGVVTFYNAFSPYATLKHAIGQGATLQLIHEHEDAAIHVLDVIAEDTVFMIERVLRESGTTGMMLCLQGAEDGLFTDEEYARLIAPSERQVVDCARKLSDINLLHLCGWDGVKDHLERWKDYETKIVNWDVDVEEITLRQGKDYFGGRVVLGGFNNRPGTLLHAGSKEDIQTFTKRLLEETGEEGVIIGADCSLPADIDRQRIRWVIEAIEEYAQENR